MLRLTSVSRVLAILSASTVLSAAGCGWDGEPAGGNDGDPEVRGLVCEVDISVEAEVEVQAQALRDDLQRSVTTCSVSTATWSIRGSSSPKTRS